MIVHAAPGVPVPGPKGKGADEPLATGVKAFAAAVAQDLELLAILHDREPTKAVLSALAACPLEQQLAVTLASEAARDALGTFATVVGELPRRLDEALIDDLASGYADVYLRHTYRAAPTESVWMTEDGLERQAPMFTIRAIYRRHNLKVTDWANRPDDHIVLQLRFIAHVLGRADRSGDVAAVTRFLDEHLLRWIRAFAARLIDGGAPDLFAASALLTAAYLEEIRDHLAAITGIERPPPRPLVPDRATARASEAAERPYVRGLTPSW